MEKLKCIKRQKASTHEARRERKKGMVPGIIYGKAIGNLMFEIGDLELNNGITLRGEHGLITIDINGEVHKGLIKEIQRDAVSHKIIHLDLEELQEGQLIISEVPVIFMGEDEVIRKGAILQKEKTNVKVECRAENLPKFITLDVREFKIGDTYRIQDVEISEEINLIDELNVVLGTITQVNTVVINEENEEEEIDISVVGE